MNQSPTPPSYREALAFWLKLGFISFGGPAGQISIMHEYLVEKKKWISEGRFMHALNYCMLLPGPEAQQLATYSGWLLHGVCGGLAAGLLFILPSAIMIWLLSLIYVTYGDLPIIVSMFSFLKPAVVAIILTALIKIGKKSLTSPIHYIVGVCAFGFIYFLNISFPLIILGAILTGILVSKIRQVPFTSTTNSDQIINDDESGYVINQYTIEGKMHFRWSSILIQSFIFILLWFTPLVILFVAGTNHFAFWKDLSLFFTKAALVTIGGAYAILPYVAQVSVETFGWLTHYEMMDGLALGETTPGPLIMVLSFVGFMAGHYQFGGSIGMATLGLTLTTYYTFLPSFLFIFTGAPFIERTHSNPYVKTVLTFATAAVTGVILNLGLLFGKAVIMTSSMHIEWIVLAWIVISFIFLQFRKVNMIAWIGVSLGIGIIRFILQGL